MNDTVGEVELMLPQRREIEWMLNPMEQIWMSMNQTTSS
jgi:hypothetical protein